MRRTALFALALFAASCSPNRPKVRSARDLNALDPALVAKLDAPLASDRMRAAFELGEIGIEWRPALLSAQVEAEAQLVHRLEHERDLAVREQIVAALGRVGRSNGRYALLREIALVGGARARAGFALSFLYHRLRDQDLDPVTDLRAIEAQLVTPETDIRRGVVAALAEMHREPARMLLRRQLSDSDAICRAYATRGLGAVAIPDDMPFLEKALKDDDERVAAFASLGVARMAEKGIAPTLAVDVLRRHKDVLKRPAVILALANEGYVRPELAPVFAEMMKTAPEPSLGCLAALGHDRITGKPELVEGCTADRTRLVGRIYAEAAPTHVQDLEPLLALSQGDARARAVAAAALGRYDDPRARQRLLDLAADSRPSVWGAASEGASEARLRAAGPVLLQHLPSFTASGRGVPAGAGLPNTLEADELEVLPVLLAAIAQLQPKGAVDAIRPLLDGTPNAIARAAEDALATLMVKGVPHPATPKLPYDDLVLPPHPVVRLETTRGVVRIALDPDAAPRTVRNFVGLVSKHFYDGLTWHRVVPGFVAQGGDPRGDGSGGAGYFVPCEPNPKPYKEGTVGMALDGLDTGSSQFFVMLAPEPRLEGRYTAFGDVVEGMATVRQLIPDDKIINATVEPTTP